MNNNNDSRRAYSPEKSAVPVRKNEKEGTGRNIRSEPIFTIRLLNINNNLTGRMENTFYKKAITLTVS